MKKLLLILICLFVSFEVRSESDDLNGKNLLCQNTKERKRDPNDYYGFQFLKNSKVKIYKLVVRTRPFFSPSKSIEPVIKNNMGEYNTTLEYIDIDYWTTNSVGERVQGEYRIDRSKLMVIRDILDRSEFETKCRVIEENLKNIIDLKFEKRKKEYQEEIKRKENEQKI